MSQSSKVSGTLRELAQGLDGTTNAAMVELFLGRQAGILGGIELLKQKGDVDGAGYLDGMLEQAKQALRDEQAVKFVVIHLLFELAESVDRGEKSLLEATRLAYEKVDGRRP